MKKRAIFIAFSVSVVIITNAQIKVSNDGFVGIGGIDPTEQFHVFKQATANGNDIISNFVRGNLETGGSGIVSIANGTSVARLQINSGYSNQGQEYGSTFCDFNIINKSPNSDYGAIHFVTGEDIRMTIRPDGRVGIGGMGTTEQFHVFKQATADGNDIISNFVRGNLATGGSGIVSIADGSSVARLQINSGYSNQGQEYGSTFFDFNIINKSPNSDYGAIHFVTNETIRMTIRPNGHVGIGKNPVVALDVDGCIRADNIGCSQANLISDIRLKRNILDLKDCLNTVMHLRPVAYDKKTSIEETEYKYAEIGFIAQELQNILPKLVSEGLDENKILSINYFAIIPILTKAIQEQQLTIKSLQTQIDNLNKKVEGFD